MSIDEIVEQKEAKIERLKNEIAALRMKEQRDIRCVQDANAKLSAAVDLLKKWHKNAPKNRLGLSSEFLSLYGRTGQFIEENI